MCTLKNNGNLAEVALLDDQNELANVNMSQRRQMRNIINIYFDLIFRSAKASLQRSGYFRSRG